MISARRLIKMSRKWQGIAAQRRKRISMDGVSTSDRSSQVAEKGHFIGSLFFRDLLRMSEEEFGLSSDGPITLPCDSQFFRNLTSLIRKKVPKDLEKERALLLSMATYKCSSSYHLQHHHNTNHIMLSGC